MTLHTLVVGCGSIGKRHVRNLKSVGAERVSVFDSAKARAEAVGRELEADLCGSLEEGLARRPDAVLVCTPPTDHIPTALAAIEADAHVFVEKPLAASLNGVDELLAAAKRANRVLAVGYHLRFHVGLEHLRRLLSDGVIGDVLSIRAEFGQYLPEWRPAQDYREGYNARSALGGGIILDGSHELDYVRWLGGEVEAVFCAAGHYSPLEMDVEDIAAITLRMAAGWIAEVHLDSVQRGYARGCKVIGTEGTLTWDPVEGVSLLQASADGKKTMAIAPEANEPYIREMRHFLACVRGEDRPRVDGETGRRVLEIALAAKESARTRYEIHL